jgi:transcriptional regulator with XRE-family HTH domain
MDEQLARFARRLRELRTARGWPLREMAKRYHGSSSQVHDFETGRKRPVRRTAQALDDALGALGELVGILYPPEPAVLPRPETADAQPRVTVTPGRRIGDDTIRIMLSRTARRRRLDDYLGGGDTFRRFAADVEATADLVRTASYSSSTGARLFAVLAEQAQLAGWAAFDAGWHGQAHDLYAMSLTAAREANDPALTGNAQAFIGYQRLALGRCAVDDLTAACDAASAGTTPVVRALLHLRRAWAHANEGDGAAAEKHLDLAQAALHEPASSPEPDWVYWVDDLEHEIMTGRCWAVLRRPIRAIEALRSVMRRYDDTHARDKALYASFLADALFDANEVDEACAVTERAMDLSAGVASVRPQQRLLAVVRRIDPAVDGPRARDLHSRAAEWVMQARTLTAEATPGSEPIR